MEKDFQPLRRAYEEVAHAPSVASRPTASRMNTSTRATPCASSPAYARTMTAIMAGAEP